MNIKQQLENLDSPREMLELLLKNYSLSVPITGITKSSFISGLIMGLRMLGQKV